MLLALVYLEYRFLWVNVGSSGSSSDAQIFNRSDLRNCFTCVVLHMLSTHQGRADMAPTKTNDELALQNGQVVYVPDDNYRNHFREAKHKRDLLKNYFNHMGALTGQEDRILDESAKYPGGRRSWHLSVLYCPIIPRTFI